MDILAAIKREERKLEKQLGKLTSPTERSASGCKGLGPFRRARSSRREQARPVGGWQGGDCQGGEKAVGEDEEAGEQGRLLRYLRQPTGPYLFP